MTTRDNFQAFDQQMGRVFEQVLKAGAGAAIDLTTRYLRNELGIPTGTALPPTATDPLAEAEAGLRQVCDRVQKAAGGFRAEFTGDGSAVTLLALTTDKFLVIRGPLFRVRPHEIDAGDLAHLLHRNSCGWASWFLLQEAAGLSLACHARIPLAAVTPDLVAEGATGVGVESIGLMRRLATD